jgi:F0F1-type ATP synthase delta subunit
LFLEPLTNHLDGLTAAERMALFAQSGPDHAALSVTTASPLDPSTRSRWREALITHLGVSPEITFAVDKNLIAGMEVKFPLAVLRFNWRQALAEAQQEMAQHEHAR